MNHEQAANLESGDDEKPMSLRSYLPLLPHLR